MQNFFYHKNLYNCVTAGLIVLILVFAVCVPRVTALTDQTTEENTSGDVSDDAVGNANDRPDNSDDAVGSTDDRPEGASDEPGDPNGSGLTNAQTQGQGQPFLAASPTASTVLVNGENVVFDAYNINDNNYFKLRDLAYTLNGTAKQFEVGWDEVSDAISLTSGNVYTPVGGEMASKGSGDKTPTTTTSKITLDGSGVYITAYNIDGNNYFKLRDLAEAFDFGVGWDGTNSIIALDTTIGYTPE
jgi:hypothetical protein